MASLAYGTCRLFVPTDRAEDIVDIVHSALTSGTAMYGIASMKPHPLHIRALPPPLAAGSGPIVRILKKIKITNPLNLIRMSNSQKEIMVVLMEIFTLMV